MAIFLFFSDFHTKALLQQQQKKEKGEKSEMNADELNVNDRKTSWMEQKEKQTIERKNKTGD